MKTERTTILALLLLLISLPAYSQKTFEMDIWPDGLPNTNGTDLTKPYDDNARNYKQGHRPRSGMLPGRGL